MSWGWRIFGESEWVGLAFWVVRWRVGVLGLRGAGGGKEDIFYLGLRAGMDFRKGRAKIGLTKISDSYFIKIYGYGDI